MTRLSDSWYAEPLFDFEYKSYQLMAYERDLTGHFAALRFYPYLPEVHRHLERIQAFRLMKASFESGLRTTLTGIDEQRMQLTREGVEHHSGLLHEVDSILSFAERRLANTYDEGLAKYERTAQEVHMEPVGIEVEGCKWGYLLLRRSTRTRLYTYSIRMVQRPVADEHYKDVVTNYVDEISTSRFTNFGDVKIQLIRAFNTPGNAYLIESAIDLPAAETLLPIAKQRLKSQADQPDVCTPGLG
jgi:hypothetical protein